VEISAHIRSGLDVQELVVSTDGTSRPLAISAKPSGRFFRVDDFERVLHRARGLVVSLDEEPGVNPSMGTREFGLRDPDGYRVMVSALQAD
jgi:hypothetical protein